jgi:hypothetical protein
VETVGADGVVAGAAPGGVPLVSRRGDVVVGVLIRTVAHRAGRVLEVPYRAVRPHLLVVGTTGSGKTTTLLANLG